MNVLFITNEYKHPDLPSSGGTGAFISQISKKLVEKGHNVYIYGVYKKKSLFYDQGVSINFTNNLFKNNFLWNLLRSISKKFIFLKSIQLFVKKREKRDIVKGLKKYIKNNNLEIDIIEVPDYLGFSLYLDNTIPYVIRCHGSYSLFEKFYNLTVNESDCICEKKAFEKAKNIISISNYSERANQELFNIQNFKLITNGIDTEIFKPNIEEKTIPKSIFYVGSISESKGAGICIEVFLNVLKKERNATLHFVGNKTPYIKTLLKIISENKIESKVIFYGHQEIPQMINLLSRAEVVIFPSKGETFGLALCETMSLQKPVICSNIPAFNEIVRHNQNGYIANNIDEYVNLILFLFNNEKTNIELGKNARKSIVEKFNIDNTVDNTIEYYNEIITSKKS